MTQPLLRRSVAGGVMLVASALTTTLVATGPASAASASVPVTTPTAITAPLTTVSTTATCLAGRPARRGVGHAPDPMRFGPAQDRAVQSHLARVAPVVRAALPKTVTINVRAHVIKGKHASDPYATKSLVRQSVANLNSAYSGGQAADAADTRYRFKLYSTDTRKKDSWYHLTYQSKADKSMRRTLRKGHGYGLNIYFVRPKPVEGGALLGWSTFPWRLKAYPHLDGVVVNIDALKGGAANGYNLGDTVVHETGHWLGLLHTFEGGCSSPGDHVADTPAEAQPSYRCDTTSDTCRSPGLDPVHNFMDYSLDSCMDMFTPGQSKRLDHMWSAYRAP